MPSAATSTRDDVLRASARLFADRGYRGTSVEQIGAACGISGPAVYKHFRSKHALLAQLLTGVSEMLLGRGREVVAGAADAEQALWQLVAFHTDFALAEAALIRTQDRDLWSLQESAARTVRRLQRSYVELWVGVLREVDPRLSAEVARTRAHATFGLLNSAPYSARTSSVAREELAGMALRALGVPARRGGAGAVPGRAAAELPATDAVAT